MVAELGKGFRIHDRVLRPSKVAVSVEAGHLRALGRRSAGEPQNPDKGDPGRPDLDVGVIHANL